MKQGRVIDFVELRVMGMGAVAIEDIRTYRVEVVQYDLAIKMRKRKGRLVLWDSDESGLLTHCAVLQ